MSELRRGDVVPGNTYRGRYNLVAFRSGQELGNVWEQSEVLQHCLDVAEDVFELEDEQLAQLATGEKVSVGSNPYHTDYLQILTIPSRN